MCFEHFVCLALQGGKLAGNCCECAETAMEIELISVNLREYCAIIIRVSWIIYITSK